MLYSHQVDGNRAEPAGAHARSQVGTHRDQPPLLRLTRVTRDSESAQAESRDGTLLRVAGDPVRIAVSLRSATAFLNARSIVRRHIKHPVMIDQSEANAVEPAEAPEQILIDPFIGEKYTTDSKFRASVSMVTR